MTFEEKLADTWYNNSKSTAADLIQSAIDEGYTLDEAKEKIKGTKWEPDKRGNLAKAYKRYDKLTSSENEALQEKRRGRLYGHKKEDPMLFPELNEETAKSFGVDQPKEATQEQKQAKAEKVMGRALSDEKARSIIDKAKEAKAATGPDKPAGEKPKRMKVEAETVTEEPETNYKTQLGWMLSDEGYLDKTDGKDTVTAKALAAKAKEEGWTREQFENAIKGKMWESSGNLMKEIENLWPEEVRTPTAGEENAAEGVTEEDKPEVAEMKGTLKGVDLSDGLSMSEAEQIASAYEDTSKGVKADMYLNYLRNNLKLTDDQIKKIVNATKTDSALRKEFYEGSPTIDNVGGVTGSEMRRQKQAGEALGKDFDANYDKYKKDAEKANADVAKADPHEKERNPRSVISALKNGEFGDIGKDADPEERKQAFQTAIYLGGDIVATALKNIGVTFKGGQPTGESMWTQRQKQKFEAATASANKALDAGTETEIGGKQRALEYSQNVQKAIDDGRVQKMLDSLGEDIKADDLLRDMDRYETFAKSFKGKSLEDKAAVIIGSEIDGNQLTPQALVALLATLNEDEYKELGQKVAEMAKGVGAGIGEAVKGLFPSFFGNEPGSPGALAGDIARGDTRAIVDDVQAGNQRLFDKLTNINARRAKNQAEADRKAADINSVIKTKFPELNFVGVNNGMVVLQANEAAQKLAKELGFLTNGSYDASTSIKLTNYVYDQFR